MPWPAWRDVPAKETSQDNLSPSSSVQCQWYPSKCMVQCTWWLTMNIVDLSPGGAGAPPLSLSLCVSPNIFWLWTTANIWLPEVHVQLWQVSQCCQVLLCSRLKTCLGWETVLLCLQDILSSWSGAGPFLLLLPCSSFLPLLHHPSVSSWGSPCKNSHLYWAGSSHSSWSHNSSHPLLHSC